MSRPVSTILIGYRGCGKTTIGRRLADKLWQKFIDTDELIVSKAAMSIADVFEQHGEARFRELEAEAVREVAALQEHVVALGGGALVRPENLEALKKSGHKIIYLRCEPEELYSRIKSDPATMASRPNLTSLGGGVAEINKVLSDREPIYRKAMDAELDVTNLTPDEAVVYIVRLL
jgi:shikimate kinase